MKGAILIMFFKIIFELSAFSPNFKKVFISAFLWAPLLLYLGRAQHGIHYLSGLLIDGPVLSTHVLWRRVTVSRRLPLLSRGVPWLQQYINHINIP